MSHADAPGVPVAYHQQKRSRGFLSPFVADEMIATVRTHEGQELEGRALTRGP